MPPEIEEKSLGKKRRAKRAVQVLTLYNPYYKAYTYIAVVLTPLSRDDALGPYGPSVDLPYLAGLVSAVA